ncbi:hypothetical protein C5167_042229 [Papaver somniferum]|uniref:Uncharacterized protein n=1 Tax=Papaver somniferum TaxID=3469 RepID=A0A4Y7L4U0_PAPSO|nr:hypothetical protein C5167_042229 [Papaver somniferum]
MDSGIEDLELDDYTATEPPMIDVGYILKCYCSPLRNAGSALDHSPFFGSGKVVIDAKYRDI